MNPYGPKMVPLLTGGVAASAAGVVAASPGSGLLEMSVRAPHAVASMPAPTIPNKKNQFDPMWQAYHNPVRREPRGATPRSRALEASELLGKPDENPLGAADVAEPISVLILDHFADELRATFTDRGPRQ